MIVAPGVITTLAQQYLREHGGDSQAVAHVGESAIARRAPDEPGFI